MTQEREEFSHALTIEIVRDIAKERGITLPILVDASGIRTFMITAYNEGFAAATAKADARIKELEKELASLKSQSPIGYIWFKENGNYIDSLINSEGYFTTACAVPVYVPVYLTAAPPVREGWVSVPREPTPEMLEACGTMNNYMDDTGTEDVDHIDWYKAMIAASEDGRNV